MHNVEVRVTDDKDGHHQPEYEEEYDVGGAIVCSALPIHRAAANNTKQDHAFALVNTHWNKGQKAFCPSGMRAIRKEWSLTGRKTLL